MNDCTNIFCFPIPSSDKSQSLINSMLYIYYKRACVYSWIFFLLYEIFIEIDFVYSKNKICNNDYKFDVDYFYSYYVIFGAFLSTCCFVLFKMAFSCYDVHKTIPLIVVSNIILISTISTGLSIFLNWGGLCIDKFNVASPAAIWGEWAATGPLLIFLTITIDNKTAFTKIDVIIIFSFFMCILFGFFIVLEQPMQSAQFLLFMSFLSYSPILYLPFYNYDDFKIKNTAVDIEDFENEKINNIIKKRKILSILISGFMSLFSVNYLFACFDKIDYSTTIILYQILTYIVKGVFVFVVMDLHVNFYRLFDEIMNIKIQSAKRKFIKYIFHEIRTPLNSIVIGIDLLLESFNPDFNEKTVIHMMKTSSDNIIETLDNLISVQKIEEKKIDIKLIPMSLENSIQNVINSFDAFMKKKNINVIKRVSPNTPEFVLGDMYGLENVFSNIINNSIKFSKKNRSIYIIIDSSITPMPNIMNISISITDEGHGIEKERLENIFNNEIQSRPVHLNKGQGTGLGLYFCKNIVELHGGKIEINSKVGKGTQVKITIPFTIVKMIDYNISGKQLTYQTSVATLRPLNAMDGAATAAAQSPLPMHDIIDAPRSTPMQSLFMNMNIAEQAQQNLSVIVSNSSSSGVDEAKSPLSVVAVLDKNVSNRNLAIGAVDASVEYIQAAKKHKDELMVREFKFAENFNVLIVDDSELNCKMIIMLLHKFGIKSQYVENGKRAVNKMLQKTDNFDFIMMDNLMPVMNGTEATKFIRQNGFTGLIIGITGNVMEKEKNDFINMGADIVLSKPIKMDTLKMILKFIEKNGTISKWRENMVISIKNGSVFPTMEWTTKI